MTSFPRLEAVAFDLDGLMFNTEDLYHQVGRELLDRRGKQFTTELLDAMMGLPSIVALQVMIDWHGLDATVDQLEAETDEIFPPILQQQLRPMPGLMELLDGIEVAAIPKAIATSSRRVYVETVLGVFDMESRFQFILTADDVERGKPDPEIYTRSANRFGVAPERMMVLEDSQNGAKAAVDADAFVVAVRGEHSRDHDFGGARMVVDSLEDRRIYDALGL